MNALQWQRLGLLDLGLPPARPTASGHALLPTPDVQPDGTVRLYFSTPDAQGRARPFVVDVDPRRPTRALAPPRGPLLEPGTPGSFDDAGVVASSVVHADDGRVLLFYVGFELLQSVRYRLLTGLAVSGDGGRTFVRSSSKAVLERSAAETLFRCGPYVRRVEGGYRMWYVAGSRFTDVGGRQLPEYDLRTVTSTDGQTWPEEGVPLLAVADADEHGLGRPWPVRRGDADLLFLSVRRRSLGAYRVGCAVADGDGAPLRRADEVAGLDVAAAGFDDTAIMYLAVVDTPAATLGFYNGNDFGRDGIGVVRLSGERLT